MQEMFKALSDPTRRRVLQPLRKFYSVATWPDKRASDLPPRSAG